MKPPIAGSGAAPQLLIARILGRRCALPIEAIGSIAPGSRVDPAVGSENPGAIGNIPWRRWRLPVFDAREQPRPVAGRSPVVLLKQGLAPLAMVVDDLEGLRSLDGLAEDPLPAWARGTAFRAIIRDRGEPVFLVDLEALGRDVSSRFVASTAIAPAEQARTRPAAMPSAVPAGAEGSVPAGQPGGGPGEAGARRMTARRVLLGRVRSADALHGVAIDADRVVHVLPFRPPSPVPGAPPELLGLFAWRRRGVALVNIAALIHAEATDIPPRRVVLCRAVVPTTTPPSPAEAQAGGGSTLLGLPLDDVLRLAAVEAGSLLDPAALAPRSRVAAGRFALGGESITLLDVDAIASILLDARS